MAERSLEDWVERHFRKSDGQVSHGLNLALRLAEPDKMWELLLKIQAAQPRIRMALSELGFVHFARFLPSRDGSALMVITEFDGPLEPYVMDFVIAIGDEFRMMLEYVVDTDRPKLPVRDHPEAFWDFVRANNRVHIQGLPLPEWLDYPLYSAYPQVTVLDIVGPRRQLPPPAPDRPWAVIEHHDVQANILRGYRASWARHFVLEVKDAPRAAHWLAGLTDKPQGDVPQIGNDLPWSAGHPPVLLNLGLTGAGLLALGALRSEWEAFPVAFRDGPAKRAKANGDTGDSAPEHWRLGRPAKKEEEQEHAMLMLFGRDAAAFAAAVQAIEKALPAAGLELLHHHDTEAIGAKGEVYFGYRDGIANPRIAAPCAANEDHQPAASPGEFILGPHYASIFGGPSIGTLPPVLARNGSFCAVRMLEQHVDAFEALLDEGARRFGCSRKMIAAKLMGRWLDGTPVVLHPDDAAKALIDKADCERNDFDYAPSYEYPASGNDHEGLRCPVGAHIRRANPRTARVAGARYSRRLMRRGMPYHLENHDGTVRERGLFGLFFCGSLERQFEFVQQQWLDGDLFASGIRGTQDPIAGAQSMCAEMLLPGMGPGGSVGRLPLPRLTTTRGSLYLLLPGLQAVRELASRHLKPRDKSNDPDPRVAADDLRSLVAQDLTTQVAEQLAFTLFPAAPVAKSPPPACVHKADAFDPSDRAFVADPYPAYAEMRAKTPVRWVRQHEAFWVLTHLLVSELYRRTPDFLKLPPGSMAPRGLFTMEAQRHALVRPLLEKDFKDLMQRKAPSYAKEESAAAIAALPGSCFDLVGDFAARVPRQVLFRLMGIPEDEHAKVDRLARTVMRHADRTLDEMQQLIGRIAGAELVLLLGGMLPGALWKKDSLLHDIAWHTVRGNLTVPEAAMTLLHFVLGGYLSTEFLLCTGVRNLLRDGGTPWQALLARPAQPDPAQDTALLKVIAEMRRFDTPLAVVDRYAGHDGSGGSRRGVTLGTQFIPEGTRVLGLLGSANRDEKVFRDAARFDIIRDPNPHLALGTGTRDCIGTPLQALVAPIALAALLAHAPRLQPATTAEPPWNPDLYLRSFDRWMLKPG